MTNAEMKARVRRILGNQKASDIYDTDVQSWINEALTRVIQLAIGGNRHNLNLFYELQTSWTTDTATIAGQNWVSIPDDKLAIVDVQSYDDSAAVNKNTDRTYPLTFMPYKNFTLLTKDTGTTGYPRIWSRRGKRIYFWPTPSADFLTMLELIGIMKEPEMTADSDTPNIDEQWHDTVCYYAAHVGAVSKGWYEMGGQMQKLALEQIQLTSDFVAIEEAATAHAVAVEGMPTRGSVYGEN